MEIYIHEGKVFVEVEQGYLLCFASIEEFVEASDEEVQIMIANAIEAKHLESQM